ncbi:MAG: hypothetical protein R3345_06155 [Fulvivirga sp.]|nr:hypothetical protein [Fulvivirga sp.]
MKYLFVIILAFIATDIDRIAKINELKKKAKTAYNKGEYKQAIEHYTFLLDSMQVEDENIKLNLANAFYQLKDSAQATSAYNELIRSEDQLIKSVAHQQLGIMANRAKKFEEALTHFKNAIKADPSNDDARYNYEMLKKMLDKQKDQKQDQQDQKQNQKNKNQDQKQDQQNKNKQDQQQKDQQQNQDQKNKEGDQGKKDKQQQEKDQQDKSKQEEEQQKDQKQEQQDEQKGKKGDQQEQQQQPGEESEDQEDEKQAQPSSLSEKLKDMKISEEKAKMILEALKNNEIQYIQQDRRKATKRKDPDKPDW